MPIDTLARRRRILPWIGLLIATISPALIPNLAEAQSAQPAKKDSSPRVKPKDVTLTATVAPIEAKPGETVIFKVTAKLNPGWHIYTYAKNQEGPGPRNTKFDFFDTAGLVPEGDWSASKAPIREKEPAFPELESVSYFDGEVTWSLPLKVPADATPGKKTLRCQASYQICNAQSCSFPGQWTIPGVELVVLGGQAKLDSPKSDVAASPALGSLQPKKKDTSARLRPKGVEMTASASPNPAKPGESVVFKVTAKLNPGWHIYDYAKEQPPAGPRATQFDFFDTGSLVPQGDWTASTTPILKEDPAFDNLPVAYFEDEVSWTLTLKVPGDAKPGDQILRCQAGYQICDPNSCSPPGQWTLPEVKLAIAGDANVVAMADPSAAASTPAPAPAPDQPAPAVEPEAVASAAPRAVSEVERTAQQGVIPLMIASALGGLLALVMPCVWPMVPITVNFFVKQGQSKSGSATGLAIVYCLAIIGVFTAVGVLCSFFVSATALPRLANNPWLNFGVAALFFAFGLSLLGLFEIRLPNALLNASAKGEGRGGLIGVVFMALTLTITSFTCTFPVVGGLLVMASTGQFFYPIIGLGTFATVLALPFFLLALSPGLLSKMPRSGDWMNTVKVVGGLVEIGAAFKFLNTAELAYTTPENAWFDAQFVLTAWVVLSAVCGFYLLGFFRTDHDHEEARVGPGRMVLGCSFLGMALFMAPALFGRAPKSPVWDRLVVGLLPPDVFTDLLHAPGGPEGNSETTLARATATDPKEAERQERRFHGVWWGFSYEQAIEQAKAENKPVLIDFTGVNCANCRLMESNVLPRPDVVAELKKFVTVQLYTLPQVPIASITSAQSSELAERNAIRQVDLTSDATNPFYVVLSPDEKVLGTIGGYREVPSFIAFLNESRERMDVGRRVAQAQAR